MPNTADIAAQAGSLHAALSELVPVFEHAMKTPGYGQDESSREEGEDKLDRALDAIAKYEARILAAIEPQAVAETFQQRVQPWMLACFGEEISADRVERGDRLLEEVFELLQSGGYDPARVLPLRDYVWSRDAGEPSQEVGGVEVTLAAYCLAHGLDKHVAGETELARIWTKVEQIRAKQAAKPKHSPLPVYPVTASDERAVEAEDIAKIIDPHSFLLIRSEHEWEEDMVKSSQELALSKANRILALRPQSAAAPKAQPVQDIVSDERAVEAEPALSIARAAANEMLAANTQWRLDPKYILTICDALEAAIAAAPKAQPVQDIASEKAAGALERAKATLELYHRGGLGDEHFYADLTVTDALCIVKAALAAAPQEQLAQAEPAKVTYRNWRGETAERQIIPQRIWYGSTEWHPESQWLITAVDVKKGVERDFALSGFSQPVQGWQTESGIERRARARDWLRNRWSEPHPNEGHVKQLADYAAFLAAAPLPAGPSSKETANGGIDAMVEAAARVITANEYGLAEGEPDHNRDDWVSENWPKRADYAREILTAAGHINPAKGDQ